MADAPVSEAKAKTAAKPAPASKKPTKPKPGNAVTAKANAIQKSTSKIEEKTTQKSSASSAKPQKKVTVKKQEDIADLSTGTVTRVKNN